MKLSYGEQLSPNPIKLSIGTLKKPKLREIANIGFDEFSMYEVLMKLTPERYYTEILKDGKEYWDSLDDDKKSEITMYQLILETKDLQKMYTAVFNFFFIEKVVFKDGLFVLLRRDGIEPDENTAQEDISGVIYEKSFRDVLELLQQVCQIYKEEQTTEGMKFKNKTARKIYEKMLKAQQEQEKQKKADLNMTLPNIISAVSNCHPAADPIDVHDLTLFQLLDAFDRLVENKFYDINSMSVSFWGV